MPQATSVTIFIFFGCGSRHETKKENGMAHFIEHMLFRGTDKRPTSQDICAEIEGLGGFLNGGTDKDFTEYYVKVPADRFATAVNVLTDMVLRPKFSLQDIAKEKEVIGEEIAMCYDDHQERCEILIDSILWPNHSLGRSVAGSIKSINNFNAIQLQTFKDKFYNAGNAVFSVAGNIKHKEVTKAAKTLLTVLPEGNAPKDKIFKEKNDSQSFIVDKRETEQVHLTLAIPTISRQNSQRYQLDMLNTILAGGMSGRLFSQLRDNQGLVYTIESYQMRHKESGVLAIYAATQPSKACQALASIINEIKKLAIDGVGEGELHKAKELVRGRLILKAESTKSVAASNGSQLLLNGQILENDDVLNIIEHISAADIQNMAVFLLKQPRKLAVVGHVSDEKTLQKMLRD